MKDTFVFESYTLILKHEMIVNGEGHEIGRPIAVSYTAPRFEMRANSPLLISGIIEEMARKITEELMDRLVPTVGERGKIPFP